MKHQLLVIISLFSFVFLRAQPDPEFPRGWVMYLEGQQGVRTEFDNTPDLFVISLCLAPQATLIPGYLRLGGVAGLGFTNKEYSGLFGPRASLKLKNFKLQRLGTLFNLQLQLEHLWGTRDERLIGGGLNLELIQMISIQLSAHRGHSLGNWWFRAGAGYNLFRKKRKSPTGDDPFN